MKKNELILKVSIVFLFLNMLIGTLLGADNESTACEATEIPFAWLYNDGGWKCCQCEQWTRIVPRPDLGFDRVTWMSACVRAEDNKGGWTFCNTTISVLGDNFCHMSGHTCDRINN